MSLLVFPGIFYAEEFTNTPNRNNYGLQSDGVVSITDDDNSDNVATYDSRDFYRLANGVDSLIAEDVSGKGLLTSTLLEYGISIAEMGDTSNVLAPDSEYHTTKKIVDYQSIDRLGYIPSGIDIELPTVLGFDNASTYNVHNITVGTYSGIDDGIRRLAQSQYDKGFADSRSVLGDNIELTATDYVVSTTDKNVLVTKAIPTGWYEGKGITGTIDVSSVYNKGFADSRSVVGNNIELTSTDYVVSTTNKNVVVTKAIPMGWYEGKGITGTIDVSSVYDKGYSDGETKVVTQQIVNTYSGDLTINYHVHTTSGTQLGETRTAHTFDNYNTVKSQLDTATVKSTQGGCFTTPYYYYTQRSQVTCPGTVTDFSQLWRCGSCGGYKVSEGWCHYEDKWTGNSYGPFWYGHCNYCGASYEFSTPTNRACGRVLSSSTTSGSGYTVPSGASVTSTVYACSCGHAQGDVVYITIVP